MKRILLIVFVLLLLFTSLAWLCIWFDIATSWCNREHGSYIFHMPVTPFIWWFAFIGGTVPSGIIYLLWQTGHLKFN